MTDTERDLLRAITGAGLTDPDAIRAARADDTPRLALADYWEENGEGERAEFVRVQCKLAELEKMKGRPVGGAELAGWLWGYHRESVFLDAFLEREHGDECEYCLRKRERALLDAHGWDWLKNELPQIEFEEHRLHQIFERGFIPRLCMMWTGWLTHAATILERHPIERVKLTTWPDDGWESWLPSKWPAIRIELPPEPVDRQWNQLIGRLTIDIARQMLIDGEAFLDSRTGAIVNPDIAD